MSSCEEKRTGDLAGDLTGELNPVVVGVLAIEEA